MRKSEKNHEPRREEAFMQTITTGQARQTLAGLKKDFIPGGPIVNIAGMEFRELSDGDPAYQCCCQTSHDMQSGPIFCGSLASRISISEHIVAICEGHWKNRFQATTSQY